MKMKAVVMTGANKPWQVQEVPVPKAEPGLVLVKIHASGMCYTDVWATQGAGGDIYPQTPGHEVVGEIVEVGAGVHTRKVGDRVGTTWVQSACGRCAYCRQNRPLTGQTAMNCDSPRTTGFATQGGHAEYIAISAEGTVLLPDGLDYTDAAPMMCAGYTTWSGLRDAEPKPGDRIAVLGIGGLGHVALQFSKALGYETIAITHSPDKGNFCPAVQQPLHEPPFARMFALGSVDCAGAQNRYRARRAIEQRVFHRDLSCRIGFWPWQNCWALLGQRHGENRKAASSRLIESASFSIAVNARA